MEYPNRLSINNQGKLVSQKRPVNVCEYYEWYKVEMNISEDEFKILSRLIDDTSVPEDELNEFLGDYRITVGYHKKYGTQPSREEYWKLGLSLEDHIDPYREEPN